MELRTEGRYLNVLSSSLSTSAARRAERAVLKWVKGRISSAKVKAVDTGNVLAGGDGSGAGQAKAGGTQGE